jgi:chaperone BCS1
MQYKGCWLVFWHHQAGDIGSREEVSISCFGRSLQILKELLNECCTKYAKLVQGKTCLYEPHQDSTWIRSLVLKIRHTLTVILDESKKRELLEDIREFLDPASQ